MAKKITIAILVLFWLYLISPFIGAIGMGALLAVLFHPWMNKLRRGRFPNSVAAGLFTLAVTLVIFLPITGLAIGSVNAGLSELKQLRHVNPNPPVDTRSSDVVFDNIFENPGVDSFLKQASKVFSVEPEKIEDQLRDWTNNLAVNIGDALSSFIGRIPSTAVSFAVFLFALFYFLADGMTFVAAIRRKSFFHARRDRQAFHHHLGALSFGDLRQCGDRWCGGNTHDDH